MTRLIPQRSLVISAVELTKVYRKGLSRKATLALDEVSFDIGVGECCGLVGPNGAGKSTLIKIVLGVERCDSGTVTMIGRRGKRSIGFVPERPTFFEDLDAYRNLLYHDRYARISGVHDPESRTDEVLHGLSLYERRTDAVSVYSKGMRQKLAIARALVHEPSILIMDEPFSGLDPSYVLEIREYLREISSKGATILLSSHDLGEIGKLCDTAIFLDHGKVVKRISFAEGDTTTPFKITLDRPDKELLSRLSTEYAIEVVDNFSSFYVFSDNNCIGKIISEVISLGGNIVEMKKVEKTVEDTYIELFGRKRNEGD